MLPKNECYPFVGEHTLCCLCRPKEKKHETDIRAPELQPMAVSAGQEGYSRKEGQAVEPFREGKTID